MIGWRDLPRATADIPYPEAPQCVSRTSQPPFCAVWRVAQVSAFPVVSALFLARIGVDLFLVDDGSEAHCLTLKLGHNGC